MGWLMAIIRLLLLLCACVGGSLEREREREQKRECRSWEKRGGTTRLGCVRATQLESDML